MEKSSKELREELSKTKEELGKVEWRETKKVWEQSNWFLRIIIIVGLITLSYILFLIGGYIRKLIG